MIWKNNILQMRKLTKFKIIMTTSHKMMKAWPNNLAKRFNNKSLKRKWLRTFKLHRTRSSRKKFNKNRLYKTLSKSHKIWVKVKENWTRTTKRSKPAMRSINLTNMSGNKKIQNLKSSPKIKTMIQNLKKNNLSKNKRNRKSKNLKNRKGWKKRSKSFRDKR